MRTSPTQFETMVQFMEVNGDLIKPVSSAQGRSRAITLWHELRSLLDGDPTGDARPNVDKWKKVWSDLKLNTKKKAAKIHRSQNGTGGGPALSLTLTALELRVLHIMGGHAATGLPSVVEAGLPLIVEAPEPDAPPSPQISPPLELEPPSPPASQIFASPAPILFEINNWETEPTASNINAYDSYEHNMAVPTPPMASAPRNVTVANSPGPSPAVHRRLNMSPQRRLGASPPQQRRARGRHSPRRRINAAAGLSHADRSSTAQIFLRSDTAHRDFERERWERDDARERERSVLREREITARERELALAEGEIALKAIQVETMKGWQQIANRVLDMAERFISNRIGHDF